MDVPSMAIPRVRTTESPTPGPGSGDRLAGGRLSEHCAAYDGPGQADRDFGVPADHFDSQFIGGLFNLVENGGRSPRINPLRQKHRRKEPTGSTAAGRDIIGVDVDRVPADQVRGERNGVSLCDQRHPAK